MALAHDTLTEAWVFQKVHTNKRQCNKSEIKEDNLVYLSMKNISMPKGRASKLVPKYIGPYRVMRAIPLTSNYKLELPMELIYRRIHPRFHISLLRPHQPNDNNLFLNRKRTEPYDFGTPDNAEWYVDEIVEHRWKERNIEFLVKWNIGNST
jgi:hypothetical protein